jgi:murein DD-endopeptidase MepM/ murein hydrolase activator NlpD
MNLYKSKNKKDKLLSNLSIFNLLLIFSLVFVNFNPNFSILASSNSRIASITEELREINSSVENISKKKDTLTEETIRIDSEIKRTEEIIQESENIIKELELEIKSNQQDIDALTKDIKYILKEMQITGNPNPVRQILAAENLSEFLSQLYLFSSRHDKLRESTNRLENINLEKESNIKLQSEVLEESKMTKEVLLLNKKEKERLLNEYSGKEEEYTAKIQKLKREQQELERLAIQSRIQRENSSQNIATNNTQNSNNQTSNSAPKPSPTKPISTSPKNPPSGNTDTISPTPTSCWFEDTRDPGISGFINPVPSATVFRGNDFGCPTVSGRYHDGIDLHSNAGNSVLATASGVVVNKGNHPRGYGYWILLRHTLSSGENIYSLYAHLQEPSSLEISQSVSTGQVIGKVGCTGNCEGNHVHFMLYSNSYERTGLGCAHGSSKCFNPRRWIAF